MTLVWAESLDVRDRETGVIFKNEWKGGNDSKRFGKSAEGWTLLQGLGIPESGWLVQNNLSGENCSGPELGRALGLRQSWGPGWPQGRHTPRSRGQQNAA